MFPSRAANSVQVLSMCSAFAQLPSDTTLVGVKGKRSDDPFEFKNLPSGLVCKLFKRPKIRVLGALYYSFCVAFIFLIRFKKFDFYYGRDLALLYFVPKWGKRFMYEVHDEPSALKLLLENLLLRKKGFSGLVVISAALRDYYATKFPRLVDEILVAHDGANIPAVAPVPALEVSQSKFTVGYVGHLYSGKGAEIVVMLAKVMPNVDFHIVGGTEVDIERLKCSQSSNLTFHGYIPSCDVPSYLASFDVLLLPPQKVVSVHGGTGNISKYMSPLKMFEYMSSKRPIIASALPVLKEVLVDRKNCILVEPDDLNGWVASIDELRVNPELSSDLASQAFYDLVSNYTWTKRVNTIIEFSGMKL